MYVFLFCLFTAALVIPCYTLSNGICDYWLSDSRGLAMNKVLANKGLQWSLHGVWNITAPIPTTQCMDKEKFILRWHQFFQEGRLTHFIDASPMTEYTCCNHQWNEYKKHGCKANIPYKVWEDAVFDCLKTFDPDHAFVRRCQADKWNRCNRIEEIADELVEKHNCEKGWPQCKEPYTRNDCIMDGKCNQWQTYTFYEDIKQEKINLDEPYNCYCTEEKYKVPEVFIDKRVIIDLPRPPIHHQVDTLDATSTTTTTTIAPITTTEAERTEEPEFEIFTVTPKQVVVIPTGKPVKEHYPETSCACIPGTEEQFNVTDYDEDMFSFYKVRGDLQMKTMRMMIPRYHILCFHKLRNKWGWMNPLRSLPAITDMAMYQKLEAMMEKNAAENQKKLVEAKKSKE